MLFKFEALKAELAAESRALGFQKLGVTDLDLAEDEPRFLSWLSAGFAADMTYLSRHQDKKLNPERLLPGTARVICVRMDYLPQSAANSLKTPGKAYIARYALGRDYHKLIRKRLQRLADWLTERVATHQYRVFCDSAPVLEKALARKAGLGWVGKHTLVLDRGAGSWFFLGEIYTDVPLPVDEPVSAHCGSCRACMDVCPTDAIVAPYQLDSRRCIAYLTIENKGPIPLEYRPLIGNRVFGCDDCQLVCPWNKYAQATQEGDFEVRQRLDCVALLELLSWGAEEFERYSRGSAIRRVGYFGWLRNVFVALGNEACSSDIVRALEDKALRERASESWPDWLVEHWLWAKRQQGA